MTATTAPLTRLLAWRPGGYLRASGVLFGWLALRTGAQMALFVLIARSMGADGYGSLIAVMALAGVFSFAGMGASAVLVRDGVSQPESGGRTSDLRFAPGFAVLVGLYCTRYTVAVAADDRGSDQAISGARRA